MEAVQYRWPAVALMRSQITQKMEIVNNPPSGRYLKTNVANLTILLTVLKVLRGTSSRSPNLEESTLSGFHESTKYILYAMSSYFL